MRPFVCRRTRAKRWPIVRLRRHAEDSRRITRAIPSPIKNVQRMNTYRLSRQPPRMSRHCILYIWNMLNECIAVLHPLAFADAQMERRQIKYAICGNKYVGMTRVCLGHVVFLYRRRGKKMEMISRPSPYITRDPL